MCILFGKLLEATALHSFVAQRPSKETSKSGPARMLLILFTYHSDDHISLLNTIRCLVNCMSGLDTGSCQVVNRVIRCLLVKDTRCFNSYDYIFLYSLNKTWQVYVLNDKGQKFFKTRNVVPSVLIMFIIENR